MKRNRFPWLQAAGPGLFLLVSVTSCEQRADAGGTVEEAPPEAPAFEVDEGWLPDAWMMGPVLGIHVDSRDHVWVSFRESGGHLEQRTDQEIPDVECCLPAPLLLELDPSGDVVQMWRDRTDVPDWPQMLHGIFVDHDEHVWFSARDQHQVLKFTRDGRHLLTLGVFEETGGSDDPSRLGRPSNVWVAPDTNELYVADGYGNRRVIVFDAETGEYLRHWGAYGQEPDDDYRFDPEEDETPRQFSTAHGIIGSNDGLLYVADRGNERVQVFRRDGEFVMERFVAPGMDLGFSTDPEQRFLYLADGNNHKIWVLRRDDLEVVAELGTFGEAPGELQRPHSMGVDSQGNLYVGEQADQTDGRRVQRFLQVSAPAP